ETLHEDDIPFRDRPRRSGRILRIDARRRQRRGCNDDNHDDAEGSGQASPPSSCGPPPPPPCGPPPSRREASGASSPPQGHPPQSLAEKDLTGSTAMASGRFDREGTRSAAASSPAGTKAATNLLQKSAIGKNAGKGRSLERVCCRSA